MTKLEKILEELQNYKRNKEDLDKYYIEKRLNDSLKNYNDKLIQNIDFLKRKRDLTILKRLNRVMKDK